MMTKIRNKPIIPRNNPQSPAEAEPDDDTSEKIEWLKREILRRRVKFGWIEEGMN